MQLYDQCKSISKVIHQLGYPTRKRLYDWIAERDSPLAAKLPDKSLIILQIIRQIPLFCLSLETIHRCFELGKNVQLVSEEIGYNRTSIYTWRKKYILKEATALMNINDDPHGKLPEGGYDNSQESRKGSDCRRPEK